MEASVVDILAKVGYPNGNETFVKNAIQDGPKSIEYTEIVEWLSKELSALCDIDDHVNAISSLDDSNSFLMEVSSFLKEIGCQYRSLTEGHISARLQTSTDRLLLLQYLATELEAAKIICANNPTANNMTITLDESPTAVNLSSILSTLGIPVPDDLVPDTFFSNVQEKVKAIVGKISEQAVGKSLFSGDVSEKQWDRIAELQSELYAEYKIRRQMLLKRLDVTVQSFQWSERMEGNEEKIASTYYPKRQQLSAEPNVEVADILAARDDLAIIEKTSCLNVRKCTQSSVNKVVIGRVPDRGGRPNEQQPPPPEMPSWSQRSAGGFGGRGGRGGRGNHRGQGDRGHNSGGKWNKDDRHEKRHDDRRSDHGDRKKNKYNDDRGYFLSERDRHSRR